MENVTDESQKVTPFECKECGWYWPWIVSPPYACPQCQSVASFIHCEAQVLPRGRKSTPLGWKCPRCKKSYAEGARIHGRKVCRECFFQLMDDQTRVIPKHPPGRPGRPPKPKKEPWYCPDCGNKVALKWEKCPFCAKILVMCSACERERLFFKGTLCKPCYDKTHPPKPIPEEPVRKQKATITAKKKEIKYYACGNCSAFFESLKELDQKDTRYECPICKNSDKFQIYYKKPKVRLYVQKRDV